VPAPAQVTTAEPAPGFQSVPRGSATATSPSADVPRSTPNVAGSSQNVMDAAVGFLHRLQPAVLLGGRRPGKDGPAATVPARTASMASSAWITASQ
jgi:hypothetical protein